MTEREQYYQYWYGLPNRSAEGQGLGFLPAVAATAAIPIAGPFIAAGAAIVSLFSRLFGGDDQQTSYRPPANSAEQFVHLADQHGDEYVAYNVDQNSLAEAARRGNRAEDIYSYYSAFISGSTHAGASSAARKVIEDATKQHSISIARAADWLLNTAGIQRIVRKGFLPSGQGSGSDNAAGGSANIPPYCPIGSYHPFPIGHPQQDLCVPFPDGVLPQSNTPSGGQQPSSRGGGAQQPGKAGMVYDPRIGQWIVPPPCGQGLTYNPQTGRCEQSFLNRLLAANIGGIPWWLILLIALVALKAMEGGDDRSYPPSAATQRRRTR